MIEQSGAYLVISKYQDDQLSLLIRIRQYLRQIFFLEMFDKTCSGFDEVGYNVDYNNDICPCKCIVRNVLFSSLVFTIVLGSQQPSGIVYGDNRQWSLQYSNSVRILLYDGDF